MTEVAAPPLHVRTTEATKTLFAVSGDRRVVYDPSPSGGVLPDVLVVPVIKPQLDFAALPGRAPPEWWARVREGRCLLAFDSSTEGHAHTPTFTSALFAFLESQGVARQNVVWITQDRTWRHNHDWWCDRKGLGPPLAVLNYDYFIKALFKAHEAAGAETLAERRASFDARPSTRERRFVSLNFTPRPAKVAFLLRLLHDGYWDHGFISFGGFAPAETGRASQATIIRERLRDSRDFGGMMSHLEADFDRLEAMGPQYLSGYQRKLAKGAARKVPLLDETLPEHDRSWFSAVTETEIEGPRRITEKAFKPLLGFHPILILGSAGALAMIREFGFRTYYGYFDEAYDDEPHPRRRFMRVYSELVRLCQADEAEMARLEREWTETLIFNAEWGLTRLPFIYRDRIDPAFIDQLVALMGRSDRLALT